MSPCETPASRHTSTGEPYLSKMNFSVNNVIQLLYSTDEVDNGNVSSKKRRNGSESGLDTRRIRVCRVPWVFFCVMPRGLDTLTRQ